MAYAISFLTVAIYWVNHHQMFHQATRVDHVVLWANIAGCFFCRSFRFSPHISVKAMSRRLPPCFTAASCWRSGLPILGFALRCRESLRATCVSRGLLRRFEKALSRIAAYAVTIPLALVHPYIPVAAVLLVAAAYFLPDAWVGETKAQGTA